MSQTAAENKFDAMLSTLANNTAFYDQLVSAVEEEVASAEAQMYKGAVAALFQSDAAPQACGQWGAYIAWADILQRVRHAQHK